MKNKLLALFLILSLICTLLLPSAVVLADDESEEESVSTEDNSYIDSLEQGDIETEQIQEVPQNEEIPEEVIKPKTQFIDIVGRDCEEAVRVLSSIGIINGVTEDEFGPDGATTRGQMASIILRMLRLNNTSATQEQVFTDVPATHPNFKDITSAYNLGVVNGNGDGTFTPDGEVSCVDVIKMVANALGYGILAESKGGYPAGYLAVANQIGLTDGISLNYDTISRGDTAQILYNAISIDLFERTSFGDKENYGTKENDNVLTRYLGYGYVEGIVTDNGITTLTSSSSIDSDQIKIGTQVFNNDGVDAQSLIGRAVKGYYKEETNKKINTLSICFVDENLTNELAFTSEDILASSRENGFFVFDYDAGNSQKKVSVYADSYIYNGKSVGVVSLSDPAFSTMISAMECANFTLVSNDGDKVYDALFIDEYKSYEVQRVDSYGSYIYCDDLSGVPYTISLDNSSYDVFYSIYNDKGTEIEFVSIRVGDVISFYESLDKSVYKIYVSRKKAEGKISEISTDDMYTIGDKTYKRYYELPASYLELGEETVYLIDIYSNIVKIDEDAASSSNYALLMDVSLSVGKGIESYPKIRVLGTDGNYETYECEQTIEAYNEDSGKVEKVKFSDLICTDKVTLDYANVSPYMLWYTDNSANFTYDIRANNLAGAYQKRFYYRPWLTEKEKSDIASRKVIYFEKNNKGRIDKIIVPDVPAPYGKHSLLNPPQSYGMIYRSENNIAIDYVTPSTIKISPHAIVYQAMAVDYTEKDYHVAENGVYSIINGQICKMYLYSIDGSDNAGIVLRYYHLPYESRGNLDAVVVDRVTRDANDNLKLYGYSKGIEYEAIIEDDTRLIQRNIYYDDILTTSNSSKVESLTFRNRVNGNNLFGYLHSVLNDLDDSAKATKAFYDLYEGMSWPYADENSISKGDIILVGKDGGEDVCYVEMMVRADDGLMQVTRESTDFAGKVTNGNDFALGVVREYKTNSAKITIHGPLDTWNRRYTTYGDLKVSTSSSKLANGRFNALGAFGYETHNFDVNYSQCIIWEYDYQRGLMKKLNGASLKVGDVILIRGSEYAPREIVVLKNNPNIPDLADYEAYEAMN